MKGVSTGRTIFLLTFLILVWAINWPLSKMALTYTPPILFSGVRTLFGGLLLFVVAIPRYKQLRFRNTWHIYMISSVFNIILYYGIQTIGLEYLPAGLFAVLVFLQPVIVGILSWLWLGESMYPLKIIGLVAGFAGVAIISGGSLLSHLSVIGVILAISSALAWALGTVYVKKTSTQVDAIWLVTLQLMIGGSLMTGLGTGLERWSDIQWTWSFVAILAFICVFVIAAGWWVFFYLIGAGEASTVASFTFLIPVIAIFIGTVFMGEPLSASLLVGLVLIVVSLYFINKPRKNKPQKVLALPSEQAQIAK